jgi:hypothetical protein
MKYYILVGEKAVRYFAEQEWKALNNSILEDQTGDVVAWHKEHDSFDTLLDMLSGWENFIQLSEDDLEVIESNTNIEFERL